MLRPSGVSSASEAELRRVGQVVRLDAGRGMKRRRHAIAERDRAGLVEQQHIDVARGFDRASAHRQHVALQARDPFRRCRSR